MKHFKPDGSTSKEVVLSNLVGINSISNIYKLNVDIFENEFVYFNDLFLKYSETYKLKNTYRLSDFLKVCLDFYVYNLKENNAYIENTSESFENYLKMKKKGVVESVALLKHTENIKYFHTTIKLDADGYKKYINCIFSYIQLNDNEMKYHYSLRKFINNLIVFIRLNEKEFLTFSKL